MGWGKAHLRTRLLCGDLQAPKLRLGPDLVRVVVVVVARVRVTVRVGVRVRVECWDAPLHYSLRTRLVQWRLPRLHALSPDVG